MTKKWSKIGTKIEAAKVSEKCQKIRRSVEKIPKNQKETSGGSYSRSSSVVVSWGRTKVTSRRKNDQKSIENL